MNEVRRRAAVLNHDAPAGELLELADGTFEFRYHATYLADPEASAISLTLPLRSDPYHSATLFPFFAGLLAEGSTRLMQARQLQIDEADDFGLLTATGRDLVGSVTVKPT